MSPTVFRFPGISYADFTSRPLSRSGNELGDAYRSSCARGGAIADTATGNAGTIRARLIDAMPQSLKEGLNIEWVTGNPGQMQVQLISGTLDVAFSGAIGTVDLNARGV